MGQHVLRWGLKTRFLDYVGRLPDSAVTATEGATFADGVFTFSPKANDLPGAFHDPGMKDRTFLFKGEISLTGHHGMQLLKFSDPAIVIGEHGAGVWISWEDERLPLAEAGPPVHGVDGSLHLTPHLTTDGSDLFLGSYSPGEPLDALDILPLAEIR